MSEHSATFTPGQKVTVTIEDIAFGGEGVGRTADFVVFVPFVALGEVVEVELVEVKRRFARGKVSQILQTSPRRVTPLCRYYGECGGCQYQHLEYAAQLEIKHKQICDLFERIGGLNRALVDPVIPCPSPYGYRNRIMIRSQWDKFKQGLNIGYIRTDNRLVVDIEECVIAEPALNEQIGEVRRNPPPKGGLKVTLRVAAENWVVPRDSFFQNNFFLLPKLVETVRARLQDGGCRFLLDAYCGVGFFSLELADLVERFVGIEIDAAAIKAARQNALNRQRANGEFIAGAAEELMPRTLAQMDAGATCLALDPPRKGCEPETLELLRRLGPAQILYVSCHPATLARDLNVLCAGGVFEVTKIVPLDMFPQTQHVECVADVRRRGAALPSESKLDHSQRLVSN
ncbi:MAG TPA: class I SAM-dependent RNA methyltransferase [Verrucomicrobiae bacterium]|jgi:tRNA/tmRNA/rRNA uracil-C5-methylase (TrmA/RlmC/RlmD family)|nr:class I SAM-dependent RNA methyltransferase [Verrucomicrobiae bacterium]